MKTILKRKLGRSGIEISAMGMGCWAIGGPFGDGTTPWGWGLVDDEESLRGIQCALDMGITFFDTADVYGAGHSEKLLGKALSGRRKDVVIATKFNFLFDESTRLVTGTDRSPAGIRKACEESLRRLQTDYIDLYQFHENAFPADEAQPIRDTLEELVREGKIRAYGWSTDFVPMATFFAGGEHCASIQFDLNVLDDNPDIVRICEENDLAAINRGPLAMGLLTGKYRSGDKTSIDDVRGENSPDWMRYFVDGQPSPAYLKKVDAVREILRSDGRTPVQGALAWLWARSPMTVPIPGFRNEKQVKENCEAMAFGPLSQAQYLEIEKILERTPVSSIV